MAFSETNSVIDDVVGKLHKQLKISLKDRKRTGMTPPTSKLLEEKSVGVKQLKG